MKMCVKMSSGQDDDERPRIDFSGLNEAEVKKVWIDLLMSVGVNHYVFKVSRQEGTAVPVEV